MITIEVAETIAVSPEKVWATITDTLSWQKWWNGHKLERVNPSWETGAEMIWKPGRPSTSVEFIPPSQFGWSDVNMGITIHRYFKLNSNESNTQVVYGVSIEGASFPPAGEAKERREMNSNLSAFKSIAEKDKSAKKWWEVWI